MMLKIGTRGSPLALAQSEWIKRKIEERHSGITVQLVMIKTKGDKVLDTPLSRIGGKGLFVRELEEALLRSEVDLAVHSLKDLPAETPPGLALCVFPEREDPRDALVSLQYRSLMDLPPAAVVATGSLRRSAQLLALRPDLIVKPLRGNVDTRLKKLAAGECSAMVLAVAGLKRLSLSDRISEVLSVEHFLPAVGQGALGIEIKTRDTDTRDLLAFLNHDPTQVVVRAERAFLKELQGGCQVPIAGHAEILGDQIVLNGMVAGLDGTTMIRDHWQGPQSDPENVGITLARKLLRSGADQILDFFRS